MVLAQRVVCACGGWGGGRIIARDSKTQITAPRVFRLKETTYLVDTLIDDKEIGDRQMISDFFSTRL